MQLNNCLSVLSEQLGVTSSCMGHRIICDVRLV